MSKDFVMIIDYGSGNLRSCAKAFEHVIQRAGLDLDVRVSADPLDLSAAAKIVLPGQGAFGSCMRGLEESGLIKVLERRVLQDKVPFMGICVGMQLLASRGFEHGEHRGLGWIEGEVVPLLLDDPALKIPHMGWNDVEALDSAPDFVQGSTESSTDYYFVHSFMMKCKNSKDVWGVCNYGGDVTAIVGRDNILGVQFHPEKSQDAGLDLIEGFLKYDRSE